jgi:hypothetical protein
MTVISLHMIDQNIVISKINKEKMTEENEERKERDTRPFLHITKYITAT